MKTVNQILVEDTIKVLKETKEDTMNSSERKQLMKALEDAQLRREQAVLKEFYETRTVVYKKFNLMDFLSDNPRVAVVAMLPAMTIVISIIDSLSN